MTEEQLQEIIKLYKNDPSAEYEVTWQIFQYLYCKDPFYIRKFLLQGDIKNDFLVSLYPHIKRFLDKYDATKGSAMAYFSFFINGYFSNFYRTYCTEQKRQEVLQHNLSVLYDATRPVTYSEAESLESAMCAADISTNYGVKKRNSSTSKYVRSKHERLKYRQHRMKTAVLILTLKSCVRITPDITHRVSVYTNIPLSELEHMIIQVRASISKKEAKLQKLMEQANKYFTQRILLQAQKRIDVQAQSNNSNRTAKIRRKLQTVTLVPTNRTIAAVLGINAMTVNRYVKFCKSSESTGFFELLRDNIPL